MSKNRLFCFQIIFMILVLCLTACEKVDRERIENFENNQSSFEEINLLLIDFLNNGQDGFYLTVRNSEHEIIGLYYDEENILLNDSQITAINIIDNLIQTDFSSIDVSTDRISYGGVGGEMYVYSFSGERPDYFWYEGDEERFTTYRLSDYWFCLRLLGP